MKTTHIVLTFVVLVAASIGAAFWNFYVAENYMVYAEVHCDPVEESCFVGDGENTPETYKEIGKPAYAIAVCDPWSDQCPELACAPGEPECEVVLCEPDEETVCYYSAAE